MRRESMHGGGRGPPISAVPLMPRLAALLPLVLSAAFAVWLVRTVPFPAPDELEHVSYAAIMQETGRFVPRFETHVTVDRTDLARWTDRPNYVGHPSPYYLYEGLFLDRSLPVMPAVVRVRLASLVLLMGGLAVALWAGVRAFGADRVAAGAFAVGIAWCPEALSVATQVNNDALGILAGGVAYAGALRGGRWTGPVWMAAGLMLALWAKPNAALEVGLFTGGALLLARRWDWRAVLAMAAGGLLGAAPTIPIVLGYGKLVPVAAETIWEVRSMGSFAEYWPVFLVNIGHTWGFLATAAWPVARALDWVRGAGLLALLACVAAGAWLGLRRLSDPRARVAVAAAAAFAVVLPIHLWFVSTRLGFSIPAASFRYYLPLWPGLLHGYSFALATVRGRARAAVLAAGAAALALGWMV